jgi:hypothetical protein
VALAQRALHFHVKQYARRDRIFLAPAGPRRRTGRSSRDLSEMSCVAFMPPADQIKYDGTGVTTLNGPNSTVGGVDHEHGQAAVAMGVGEGCNG